jgi:hypothetical protein
MSLLSLISYYFLIFCVTGDDVCEIILKIKITFYFNGKEIPEVWNITKFQNVLSKKCTSHRGLYSA